MAKEADVVWVATKLVAHFSHVSKLALIILLIILTLTINPIDALDNESNAMNFHGEPQYAIIVQTSNPYVNTDDVFTMELFISGAGDVDWSRISVSIPPYIVEGRTVKEKIVDYIVTDAATGANHAILNVSNITPSFYTMVPHQWYMFPYKTNPKSPEPFVVGEARYTFDNNGTSYAPLTVEFEVDDNAPGGDYNIFVHYFYKYINKWYQDTKVIPVHINYWYEGFWLRVILYSTALWALYSILREIKKLILPPLNPKR